MTNYTQLIQLQGPTQCDKKCKSLKSAVSSEESKLIEEQIREELREKISALQTLSTKPQSVVDMNITASREIKSFTTLMSSTSQDFTTTSSSPTVIRPSSHTAPSSSGPKVITGNSNYIFIRLVEILYQVNFQATIFVPLLEAGFIQRVVVSSNKKGYDYSKASVCRQISSCQKKNIWVPASNEAPREQLEVLFNYTTDIYKFEIQGSVFGNETVTSFLFQYLNETNNGTLVNYFYRTQSKSSSKINRFLFRPPVRTKYIRLIPIDYEKAIAMRFEVYSRGTLYAPNDKLAAKS